MQNLFFLAIVPPASTARKLDKLRHEVWHRFNSQHGLNSPPHITLIPPFKMAPAAADELCEALQKLVLKFKPFGITGTGVNHFDQKTIYAAVDSNESLLALQQSLQSLLVRLNLRTDRPDRKYTPHLTLAFKDLNKVKFKPAFQFLKAQNISLEFEASQIVLLQHSGKRWLMARKFSL